MRKRTINHVADTIFWYLLYFLPIISYLLFCFTEPTRIQQIDIPSETQIVSTMSVSSYSLDNENNYLPAGNYVFNEVLDFTSIPVATTSLENVDAVSSDLPITSLLISPNFIPRELQYDGTTVYIDGEGWLNEGYRYITFNENQSVLDSVGVSWLTFFNTNLTIFNSNEPDIPIEPTLNIVPFYDYMVSTYKFTENNFIYRTITNTFGENGVFNLALDNGIYLYFSWFIGVYLMHLFVDFILFIPRLSHKWLKSFTERD